MNLFIYGAGDLGREIYNTVLEINKNTDNQIVPIAFIDDNANQIGGTLDGLVIRSYESITEKELSNSHFIIAVGNSPIRKKIRMKLEQNSAKLSPVIIHPKAYVSDSAEIGLGCFVGSNTSVSIGCNIENNVIINQNCSIGHDCLLEEDTVISPGCVLSGRTKIRKATFLGSAAVTLPLIEVGEHCVVGANVTIAQDVKDSTKVLAVVRNMSLPVE